VFRNYGEENLINRPLVGIRPRGENNINTYLKGLMCEIVGGNEVICIRFHFLDYRVFDKHMTDLHKMLVIFNFVIYCPTASVV